MCIPKTPEAPATPKSLPVEKRVAKTATDIKAAKPKAKASTKGRRRFSLRQSSSAAKALNIPTTRT